MKSLSDLANEDEREAKKGKSEKDIQEKKMKKKLSRKKNEKDFQVNKYRNLRSNMGCLNGLKVCLENFEKENFFFVFCFPQRNEIVFVAL